MKEYIKPEVELIEFLTEAITQGVTSEGDGGGDL